MHLIGEGFGGPARLPWKHTKDAENTSPPLRWSGLPEGTQEIALLFETTAPLVTEPYVQWLVYKIPPDAEGLPEGFPREAAPQGPVKALQGRNSYGRVGYDGPQGKIDEGLAFRIRLYALDQPLDVPPGSDKAAFFRAAQGHIIDEAELIV